jgi:hypothetical protein
MELLKRIAVLSAILTVTTLSVTVGLMLLGWADPTQPFGGKRRTL